MWQDAEIARLREELGAARAKLSSWEESMIQVGCRQPVLGLRIPVDPELFPGSGYEIVRFGSRQKRYKNRCHLNFTFFCLNYAENSNTVDSCLVWSIFVLMRSRPFKIIWISIRVPLSFDFSNIFCPYLVWDIVCFPEIL